MQNLSKKLPPLDALVAFEAAARHSSFTAAADELNITQAAVSQRIRNLEEALDTKLFDRAHRSVKLNAAGREYQHSIANALAHIASATSGVNPEPGTTRLTIATDETVAALWLSPRFKAFTDAHEEISVRIVVSDDVKDCVAEAVDAAIVLGAGDPVGFHSEQLFEEEVFPVCSPSFLAANPQIATADGLAATQLIDLEDDRWDWMNWRMWLTECFGADPSNARRIQINSYPLVIEAAKNGLGVALGWRYLINDPLRAGALVRPMETSLKTGLGYNLMTRTGSRATSEVEAFASWVRSFAW